MVFMPDARITCITKPNRSNRHESITHVGGNGWRWPVAQVIKSIREKDNTFYTFENGKRAEVAVVDGPHGPYLRTHADGQWNDNLLALPECAGS